jgi:hypothetical protein
MSRIRCCCSALVRQGVAVALILTVLLGVTAQGAAAGRGWCRADPVIMVDGQLADVFISSDFGMLASATGPIQMVVEIPNGSKGSLILNDFGYGYGYQVSFVHASDLVRGRHTQVRISAYAPADDSSLPVSVTFAPRSLGLGLLPVLFGMRADGTANSWVSLTTP